MTKEQALHNFWSQFGVSAWDNESVPDEVDFKEMEIEPFPRITYEVITDNFGARNTLTASIWDRSDGWENITTIKRKVAEKVGYGGQMVPYDEGAIWITRGIPFAQRLADEDDSIRRIVINIEVEYLSEV